MCAKVVQNSGSNGFCGITFDSDVRSLPFLRQQHQIQKGIRFEIEKSTAHAQRLKGCNVTPVGFLLEIQG